MISVIVPAYNAARTLPACLRALNNQTLPRQEYEIIVVDDGSTDDTPAVARRYGARVVTQPNAGPAAARNRGVEMARGDLLLFTDADCVPAPDWIARLSAPFADPSVQGAKGVYCTHQPELTARFVQLEYEGKYDRLRRQTRIDFIDTYSAAYRRSVFEAMGGFDSTLRINEDVEFAFRVAEAGHRLVFVPGAAVSHTHDRTPIEYAVRKFWNGYTKTRVVRRHPGKIVRDSHTPQVIKLQMALAGLGTALLAMALLLWRREPALAGLGAWLAVAASDAPLYRKIWRRDRPVLAIAPLLVLVRALALGFGLLAGFVRLLPAWRVEREA